MCAEQGTLFAPGWYPKYVFLCLWDSSRRLFLCHPATLARTVPCCVICRWPKASCSIHGRMEKCVQHCEPMESWKGHATHNATTAHQLLCFIQSLVQVWQCGPDISAINSSVKSWLFADLQEKPSEAVMCRPASHGGQKWQMSSLMLTQSSSNLF